MKVLKNLVERREERKSLIAKIKTEDSEVITDILITKIENKEYFFVDNTLCFRRTNLPADCLLRLNRALKQSKPKYNLLFYTSLQNTIDLQLSDYHKDEDCASVP